MNMSVGSYLFFAAFALIQVGMYLSIRREWINPTVTAAIGVILAVASAILVALSADNMLIQAIMVGAVIGSLISAGTLGTAWYFHSNELSRRQQNT